MAVKAVLTLVISIGVFAIFAGAGLAIYNNARGNKAQPGIMVAVIGAIVVLVGLPLNAGLVLIQPDERGVVFRQLGGGTNALQEPINAGLNWVIPFVDEVTPYNVGRQSVTMAGDGSESGGLGAVGAISSDGQVINLDVTVVFAIDPTRVNDVHANWRGDFIGGFIVPQARSEVRNAVSGYSAEAIYSGGREQLALQATDRLASFLEREGFILVDLLVRNVTFSPEFANAIEQKQIAEQEVQRQAFLVQQAAQEAERRRTEAEGLADAAVIAAQGEANAILLRAEAESEALALINAILSQNPNLIQWQYINELGENVQLIIVPSNSPYLFDLQALAAQAGGSNSTAPSALPTPAP